MISKCYCCRLQTEIESFVSEIALFSKSNLTNSQQ